MKNFKAIAAIGVFGIAAFFATVASGDEEQQPIVPGDGVAQVATIEEGASKALSVLDDARSTSDAMPADIAEPLDEEADFGINPDLSREAIGNTTHSVYILPGNAHVCVALTVGEGVTMGCEKTADIEDGYATPSTVSLEGEDIAIYGIVPDGVGSVTVETGVSDSDEIDVENNSYYTVLAAGTPLRTLSYVGPSGQVEYPIVDPATAFEEE